MRQHSIQHLRLGIHDGRTRDSRSFITFSGPLARRTHPFHHLRCTKTCPCRLHQEMKKRTSAAMQQLTTGVASPFERRPLIRRACCSSRVPRACNQRVIAIHTSCKPVAPLSFTNKYLPTQASRLHPPVIILIHTSHFWVHQREDNGCRLCRKLVDLHCKPQIARSGVA